jgi:hypothetical protein
MHAAGRDPFRYRVGDACAKLTARLSPGDRPGQADGKPFGIETRRSSAPSINRSRGCESRIGTDLGIVNSPPGH